MNAPWLLDMVWRDVCFAHWRADAERIENELPPGVSLDRYDGRAWLSVVPFRMTAIRARGAPVLPGFGDVAEINLRTYVRVGDTRGVWFFSLDAANPAVVRTARAATGLPYFHAQIATTQAGASITYASARTQRGIAAGRFRAHYTVPPDERPAAAGTLEAFLHERYRFFARRGNRLVGGQIRHPAWTLGPTTIDIAENSLGDIIGHPLRGAPDLVYFAREARVRAAPARV